MEEQCDILGNVHSDFLFTSVSAFDNSVLAGHPYGVCAILWRSSIYARV